MDRNAQSSGKKIVKLKCSVQNYDWGHIGRESSVAHLYQMNNDVEISDTKPYAEFWMGTHESGPSYVAVEERGRKRTEKGAFVNVVRGKERLTLKDLIEQNPRVLLGDKIFEKWGPNLPFLFKVLSVAKALSIQAHPDKELATFLHKSQPNFYKDANHKPEMALALTEFEALCGFISLEELKGVVHNVPEIVEVVGKTNTDKLFDLSESDMEGKSKAVVLQSIFTQLMSVNRDLIRAVLSKLITRLTLKGKTKELTEKENIILRLEKQYHDDVGVLAAFLFNYVKLRPGQALYLGANEPHAYINGDCIECMATSDNVVRAGLTPKHRDVQTLCSMLTYKQGPPEVLQGVAISSNVVRYRPPFDEFEVDRCVLDPETYTVLDVKSGPSIFLVMEGEGMMCNSLSKERISEGDVLFVPANTEITLKSASGKLIMYRAGVNSQSLEA